MDTYIDYISNIDELLDIIFPKKNISFNRKTVNTYYIKKRTINFNKKLSQKYYIKKYNNNFIQNLYKFWQKESNRIQKVKRYLQKRKKIRLRTGNEIRYECRRRESLTRKRKSGKFVKK